VTTGWEGVTLASLVPAQVSDIVRDHIRRRCHYAPLWSAGAVRGALQWARALGWPLLPSYGMTECCSQVATAKLESRDLVLLDHIEARIDPMADSHCAVRHVYGLCD
jgi:O-succinylbenzoic acid--CoA ligase